MKEQTKKAFDFAQDLTKLLITLATGIITLSITFFHDFATNARGDARSWMEWSWAAYLLVVLFGLVTLMGMTGQLEDTTERPSLLPLSVRVPAMLQTLLFLAGLILTTIAGAKAVG